jgi:hypothetical protein
MQEISMEHPTEDALERFAMKKSTDSELGEVEGHVLGCPVCLDRVLELESFVQACRDAIPEFRKEQALIPEKTTLLNWFRGFGLTLPKLAWAPALAVLALLAVVIPNLRQSDRASVDVTLSASRGVETGPPVPARTVVRLHLDAIDIPAVDTKIELVDGQGRGVWSGDAKVQADRITIATPRLEPGTYFARLYLIQNGNADRNHLLREFAIQVR